MKEVKLFHLRFIADMAERVQTVSKTNPFAHVKLDIAALKKEQKDRTCSLKDSLSRSPNVESWANVINANKQLLGA